MGRSAEAPQAADRAVARPTLVVRRLRVRLGLGSRSGNGQAVAVRDVSFVARAGELIGVLGGAGAGSSTLLRAASGAVAPSSGQVATAGRARLVDSSRALVEAASGRVNMRLGLLAGGMSASRARRLLPAVVAASGLGGAVDRPVQAYSPGMVAALRLAVALATQPGVLLVDGALDAADEVARSRAAATLVRACRDGATVLLASTWDGLVEEVCGRALWLHEGALVADGPGGEVARAHQAWARMLARGEAAGAAELLQDAGQVWAPSTVVVAERSQRALPEVQHREAL